MKNKNYLLSLLTILVTAAMSLALVSCSSDDDSNNDIKKVNDYLNIQGATYTEGSFPASTEDAEIKGISASVDENSNTATIRIAKDNEYGCYYIGIEGLSGYWMYTPNDTRANESATYWEVVVSYKNIKPGNAIKVWVTGQGEDAQNMALIKIPKPYTFTITGAENTSTLGIVGTWYTAYYIDDGVQHSISKYEDAFPETEVWDNNSLYREWVFSANGRAEYWTWTGDDDFMSLPFFEYKINGNKVTITATETFKVVDEETGETFEIIPEDGEEGLSVFNSEFTYDNVQRLLIEHMPIGDDENGVHFIVKYIDVYWKKR